MTAIEFTDRYGGHLPSSITGCHLCEAMGCYPTLRGTPYADNRSAAAADDYEFVRCEACGGTGRIPLWRGLLRLPGLWRRGVAFVWHSRTLYGRRPTAAEWWLAIRVAFLYDWLLLSRRTARWAR